MTPLFFKNRMIERRATNDKEAPATSAVGKLPEAGGDAVTVTVTVVQ